MKRSFSELIYLTVCLIYTKFRYPSARIMRLPIDIRNHRGIDFGKRLTTGHWCRLESFSKGKEKTLIFGNDIQINDFVHINAVNSVKLGNNVLIASSVFITDLEHGSYKGTEFDSPIDIPVKQRELSSSPVLIEDNVWLGEKVSVLPGVKIGKNSIIGANSVVTKNIPANSIAVGNPARVIKKYNFETKHWEKV